MLLREFYPKLRYATMHIDYEDSEKPQDIDSEIEEETENITPVATDTIAFEASN